MPEGMEQEKQGKAIVRKLQHRNYTTIKTLNRSKCPRFGHLDECPISCRAQALRVKTRSWWISS